jgi:hypothetical protein
MKRYTKEQKEWLAAFIPGHTAQETADAYNEQFHADMTASKVKSYKTNHHVPSGTKKGFPIGSATVWTKEITDYLKKINQGKSALEVSQLLNQKFNTKFTAAQVKGIRNRLHIKSGLTGRFDKGHEPPNKGRKGYHSPGSEKGWFQKGHKPWNYAKVGAEAWTTDGYLKVKIAEPNKWKAKHLLVWEKENGKVPEGFCVSFKDGNHENCTIENLVLLSLAENAMLNQLGLRSEDPEITETGITLAKLQSKIYSTTKRLKQK